MLLGVFIALMQTLFASNMRLGLQVHVADDRAQELMELAEYLAENFPQYSQGSRYLMQMAGKIAVKRVPPTKLNFILNGPPPPLQQGQARLHDPEPHNVHRLRVKFHRYY